MARIFTSNQVNHVYVAKAYESTKSNVDTLGDINVSKDAQGNPFFTVYGEGGVVRSDILENIMYAKAVLAEKMEMGLKAVFMTVDSDYGNPVAGEDYVITVDMQNAIGMSPDNNYLKFAAARAFSATKSDLIRDLSVSLAKNLAMNTDGMFNVHLTTASVSEYSGSTSYTTAGEMVTKDGKLYMHLTTTSTFNTTNWAEVKTLNPATYSSSSTYAIGDIVINSGTIYICKTAIAVAESFTASKWVAVGVAPVTKSSVSSSLSGTYTGILLTTNESTDYIRGLKQVDPLRFTVHASPARNSSSIEMPWLSTIEFLHGSIKNGKIAADLEYFAMGERADQYRMSGWPNYIPTKYVVDESKVYDMICIHYAYAGSNEAVQKSEKDITILCERGDSYVVNTATDLMKSIRDAFNTATGATTIPAYV